MLFSLLKPHDKRGLLKKIFFISKTYVLGAQKNRLIDENVLFMLPKHMFIVIDKKIITILLSKYFLYWSSATTDKKFVYSTSPSL